MTVAELIDDVLGAIQRGFYVNRPRDFLRDRRALTKAIARYGVECHQRGWDFIADQIRVELIKLLQSMADKKADIGYLPVYLEGAVDRHIRLRADELNEANKKAARVAATVYSGLKPAAIREPTSVEVLSALYKDLKQNRKRAAKTRKAVQQPLL